MNRLQWDEWYRKERLSKKEIWKTIIGYEGMYEVSSLGRVKSFKNGRWGIGKETYLSVATNYYGYFMVVIGKRTKLIHRLVAQAFIPNPNNYPVVMHLDNNKKNNALNNLKWGTYSQNNKQAYDDGIKFGPKYWLGKFNGALSKEVSQFTKEGLHIGDYLSMKDAYRLTGIQYKNISSCCLGKLKTAGGFIWKFKN